MKKHPNSRFTLTSGADAMRAHYDPSKMKGRRNSHVKLLKQAVTTA